MMFGSVFQDFLLVLWRVLFSGNETPGVMLCVIPDVVVLERALPVDKLLRPLLSIGAF